MCHGCYYGCFTNDKGWPTCPASSPKYLAPAAENKFPVPSCFVYCLCQVLTTQQQCQDQVAQHPSQAPSLFPCLIALKGRNPPIGMLQLLRYSQRSATHSPLSGKILQEIDRTLPSYSFSTQFPVGKVLKLWTTEEVFEVGRNGPEGEGVSFKTMPQGLYGCFRKYPQIIHLHRVFHYETIHFGVPLFLETSI